ncbi:MAG TPA: hypothetical protein VII42_15175 [Caulobacteraceae bacterium]
MVALLRRLALAGLILSFFSSAVARADVLPPPTYVAGLWFYSHSRFNPMTRSVAVSPIMLMSCQQGHPNCKAANAASVVGAEVVGVDGKADADPRDVFGQAHPPAKVVVVFRRNLDGGKTALATVSFAPK